MRHASETPSSLSPPPLLGLLIRRRTGGRGHISSAGTAGTSPAPTPRTLMKHVAAGHALVERDLGELRDLAGGDPPPAVDGIIQRVADGHALLTPELGELRDSRPGSAVRTRASGGGGGGGGAAGLRRCADPREAAALRVLSRRRVRPSRAERAAIAASAHLHVSRAEVPEAYAMRRLVRLVLPSASYVAQVLNAVEARNIKVRAAADGTSHPAPLPLPFHISHLTTSHISHIARPLASRL